MLTRRSLSAALARHRNVVRFVAAVLSLPTLATSALAAPATTDAARTISRPLGEDRRPLVFVTINLLHGGVTSGLTGNGEDLDLRLDLVARELRALDADVVGVQEASTGRSRGNVAERLAAKLGFVHVYAPALFRFTGWRLVDDFVDDLMNFSEGPAIVSRFAIARSETRRLPRCHGFFDVRVALRADLATPWGEVPVFSTHLSWGACEADELARFVAERRAKLPGVLMGDLNATEDSPEIRRLVREARLIDAFRAANPTAPGFTVWQDTSSPRPTVFRRVDFIFLAPGTEHPGRVLTSRVVLNAPQPAPDGRFLWPSDHYGVVAEIAVMAGE